MALVLEQVRDCDGACCKASPRFPDADGTDCIYRDTTLGKENLGCKLMTGEVDEVVFDDASIPRIEYGNRTPKEVFYDTCVNWPQNTPRKHQSVGDTGNCCWQWVDR